MIRNEKFIISLRLHAMALLLCVAASLFGGCKEDPVGNDPQPPGSPRNLRAYPGPDAQPRGVVSWDAPADSSGITGYRVWWRKSGGSGGDSIDLDASSRLFAMIVEERAPYTFAVAARRNNLISAPATIQWGGHFPLVPPTGFTVTFTGATTATAEWTPSPDTNITAYYITWRELEQSTITGEVTVAGRQTNTILLSDIDRDRNYVFRLHSRSGERFSTPVAVEWYGKVDPPAAPGKLEVSSMGSSSVGLRWQASRDTGMITYRVSWREANTGGADLGSVDVPLGMQTVVSGLAAGKAYSFSVAAVRQGKESSPVSATWGTADRYITDAESGGGIRMYETASSNGAGLVLDPSNGGPKRVGVGSSNPIPGSVQLAIYTSSSDPNFFEIGPASAFSEYRNSDRFDRNVYISEMSYLAQSLDTWYPSESIDREIPDNGNIRVFRFPVTETGTTGQGFYVRTGTLGNYHFARVFIRKVNGRLLQGAAPNRYVELEISYQNAPNLPFAKRVNQGGNPVGERSYVRR